MADEIQRCKKLHNEKFHIAYSTQYNITLVIFRGKVNVKSLCMQNCQTNLKRTYKIFINLLFIT
jgi:hypothetical protein